MSKTIEEKVKEFDGLFMNNGTNGVLSDEFQDPKMVLVKKFFVDTLTTQKQALIAEVEKKLQKLYPYLQHNVTCYLFTEEGFLDECTCGLKNVLAIINNTTHHEQE